MFHPKVEQTLEEIGRGYEKLAKITLVTEGEIFDFFTKQKAFTVQCKNTNNKQLELEQDGKHSGEFLAKRMQQLDNLAAKYAELKPLLSTLAYATKPYVDAIYGFREVLLASTIKLAAAKEDEKTSVEELNKLNKKFDTLFADHHVIMHNLNTAKGKATEAMELYNRVEEK